MIDNQYYPNTVDELIRVLQDLSKDGKGNYDVAAEYGTFRVSVDDELKGVYFD